MLRKSATKSRADQGGSETKALPEWVERVIGDKYVKLLKKEMRNLGSDSASHGNRPLHLIDVAAMYLLAFYNPLLRSLRTIEDVSQTRQAQQYLTIRKISKSTLSDFNTSVEANGLACIFTLLRKKSASKQAAQRSTNPEFNSLLQRTIAVDGIQQTLRVIMNLLDLSASTIALLYQQHWQVALFFRWFKSAGNFPRSDQP